MRSAVGVVVVFVVDVNDEKLRPLPLPPSPPLFFPPRMSSLLLLSSSLLLSILSATKSSTILPSSHPITSPDAAHSVALSLNDDSSVANRDDDASATPSTSVIRISGTEWGYLESSCIDRVMPQHRASSSSSSWSSGECARIM